MAPLRMGAGAATPALFTSALLTTCAVNTVSLNTGSANAVSPASASQCCGKRRWSRSPLFVHRAASGIRQRAPAPVLSGARLAPALLRALLRDPRKQGTNLRLTVTPMTAKRPDGSQLSGLRPPGHRLRVNPEHGCHLGRRKQRLGFWGACRHFDGLSSWIPIAILRLLWFLAPFGSLPWMSHMVYCYHIAITSGDKATTRSRSFWRVPVAPVDLSHVA